jgi:Rrf2 family cysteine metabolism transcriptional repressor
MKISTRSEYAAKALLFLVLQGDAYDSNHPAQIQAIAQTCEIPVKYLEQILVVLRNQGLLGSRRGVAGGYYLVRDPESVSVGEVVRLMDGQTSIGASLPSCDEDKPSCKALRELWDEVDEAIAKTLDNTTFLELKARVLKIQDAGKSGNFMFYI